MPDKDTRANGGEVATEAVPSPAQSPGAGDDQDADMAERIESVRQDGARVAARRSELQEDTQRELDAAREERIEAERREQLLEKRQAELEGKRRLEWSRWAQTRLYLTAGLSTTVVLAALSVLSGLLGNDLGLEYRTRLIALLCFAVAAFFTLAGSLLGPATLNARRVQREEVRRARAAAAEATEELTNAQDVAALIRANRKQMEAYDVLARGQARIAFRNSQIAMAAGLLVLILGGLVSVATPDTTSKVTTAALTGIGGGLSGYIARTFLQTYFRAMRQLNYYFQQPLVTSYLLTAQRLVREITAPDKRDEALIFVISSMVPALVAGQTGGDEGGDGANGDRTPTSTQ